MRFAKRNQAKKRLLLLVVPFLSIVGSLPANASRGAAKVVASPNAAIAKTPQYGLIPTPNVGKLSNRLFGIDCPASNSCLSVGFFRSATGVDQSLIMMWSDAKWRIVPSPNTLNQHNRLWAIDCPMPSSCTAVGESNDGRISYPLVLRWDGISWTIAQELLATPGRLRSVSCASAKSCMAIGSGGEGRPLALKWDGNVWSDSGLPLLPIDNVFNAVSCPTETLCVSVGSFMRLLPIGMEAGALTFFWDGSTWASTENPFSYRRHNVGLSGVSCSSAISCTAVGVFEGDGSGSSGRSLILEWNAGIWSMPQISRISERGSALFAISCSSITSCVVLGSRGSPFVISWNDYEWREMLATLVDETGRPYDLRSLSCGSATVCQVAGYLYPFSTVTSTSILQLSTRKGDILLDRGSVVTATKLTKSAGLVVRKGSKVSLSVSSKYKKVCKVAGTSIKTIGKGTCLVKVVVTTKAKKKTSKTVTIKVK
jgi:hypothetical protein